MSEAGIRWHIFADQSRLAGETAACILRHAHHAITKHGAFRIVLAGGSTPRAIYALLATAESQWSQWHVYFGDERCLPMGSVDRNDTMAREEWLDHVAIPQDQVHAIPAELGSGKGAQAYSSELCGLGNFDLVLLGLGEDGHTASLFPGQPSGKKPGDPDALAVTNAPKPPPERISLSANRLSRTRALKVIVCGAGKRRAVLQLKNREDIPACALMPETGMEVVLDECAAPEELQTDTTTF